MNILVHFSAKMVNKILVNKRKKHYKDVIMWWSVTKTTVRHQNCSPMSLLSSKRAKCWVKGGVGGQLLRIIGVVYIRF